MSTTQTLTPAQQAQADIYALLRARTPIIWVRTREEKRVRAYLARLAQEAQYVPRTWDYDLGICDIKGKPSEKFTRSEQPDAALTWIRREAGLIPNQNPVEGVPGVWIMRDLPPLLEGPIGFKTIQILRNLANTMPNTDLDQAQSIIIVSPSSEVPEELANNTKMVEWPLPNRDEIGVIIDKVIRNGIKSLKADPSGKYRDMSEQKLKDMIAPNGTREAAIDAAVGLSGDEAELAASTSLVKLTRIDPPTIAKEKKRVISQSGLLEWIEPLEGGLDSIGGLDVLKGWLVKRRRAFTQKAKKYGVKKPKAILLVGIPGCGKTMSAHAVPATWGFPLIKLDLGKMKSKFVGESETNLRDALNTIDTIGDCCVHADEIEKALAGATDGSADGGVSADALGTLLQWMQDRKSGAFVICTANNAEKLPPEFLRTGRFDAVFFVGHPNRVEREAVLAATLRNCKPPRDPKNFDLGRIAEVTDRYTGAELASLVDSALINVFDEEADADEPRDIETKDLLKLTVGFKRDADKSPEKIAKIIEAWGNGQAIDASNPPAAESDSEEEFVDDITRVLNLS